MVRLLRSQAVRKSLIFLLQMIIIGLLVWYFYENRNVFRYLNSIKWQQILWIILLDTASFVVGSFLNYSMIRRLDHKVSFLDCFLLQYANNFLNKILPTIGGGAAFRAIFLKKKYQFPYSQFTSTFAGLYVISFCSTALIGLACLLIVYYRFSVFNWAIFLAFAGILAVTLVIIVFSPQVPKSSRRLINILRNIVEGWNILKKDLRFVLLYTLSTVLFLILSAGQTFLSYYALGVQTDFIPMLFLSTLGIIIAFMNFTPDGIGIKEGLFIFSTELVRIPADILVLGSFVLRGISIFTSFIFGGISYWVLFKQVREMDKEKAAHQTW